MKKIKAVSFILVLLFVLEAAISAAQVNGITGESSHVETELHEGVTWAEISTPSGTPVYNKQHINVVRFDLKQRDLYLDTAYYNNSALVNYGGSTVVNIMKQYDQTHTGKKAIAAVNGDMWMVSYAHARIEGQSHTNAAMLGYTDDVVKKDLTVSRSFNIVEGEIFTTAQIPQETPYSGNPWAFCITDDFVPNLGQPYADIKMTDVTLGKSAYVDGINRLPANNAIVMYTDRVMSTYNGFALDDAYEMLIEFDEDYTMRHGADVTGTLMAIYDSESAENPPKTNVKQMVITVRGSKINSVKDFSIGDKINFKVQIHDALGNDDIWQRAQTSIGGNIVYAKDGAFVSNGIESGYPTTMLGYDYDGNIVMLTMDGRGYGGVGASSQRYYQLFKDLHLYEAFILDGGGSMTMAVSDGTNYTPVSTPIDNKGTTYRTVNNALILAHGPERCEQGEFSLDTDVTAIEDVTNVTFPTEKHMRSFVAGPNETKISWENDCLKLTVANMELGDPFASFSYLSASELASADEYKYIVLVYKMPVTNSATSYSSELFCQCENRGAEGGQSAISTTKCTDSYEYAVFNAGSLSKWKGNITGLRIDYFALGMKNGDCMYIHNIMLAKTRTEARSLGKKITAELNTPPVLAGDCSGDGAVDNQDVVLLFRYVCGETPEGLVEEALDFDGDGKITNKDVTLLFRAVSST